MKMWCFVQRNIAIKWRENGPASVIPSPQGRTGVIELIPTKLEPSLHFESRFSGIQLLVVSQPSPIPGSQMVFLGKVLESWSIVSR